VPAFLRVTACQSVAECRAAVTDATPEILSGAHARKREVVSWLKDQRFGGDSFCASVAGAAEH